MSTRKVMILLKLSDIQELSGHINNALYEDPSRNEVKFGCDCGCGGDLYTYEEWTQILESIDESVAFIEEFCEKNDIEIDIKL